MCSRATGAASTATRHSLIVVLLLLGMIVPRVARTQAQQQGRRDPNDTLPIRVIQRGTDAYNKRDVPGLLAMMDSVFVHDRIGDSTARQRGTPREIYGWFADSVSAKSSHLPRLDIVRHVEHGPYVVLLYDSVVDGKRMPSFDIFEVRHGKVVHEWEP
jgi:predicted SnoaL-like aldol condensation-catalyzing enzyme